LQPAIPFIDAILQADLTAPRKQQHTAHRIWCRIRAEVPAVRLSESTIREYVRKRKIALGLTGRETFIPQSYVWGGEAQVDWYEAYADICGERQKAFVFCMRSMASGGAFHCAFPHASQQAFLEAHEKAFDYFGGVFTTLRFDNLKSAVQKILRGHQREETIRFIAFRSHWGFAAEFCTPGQGHEKGGVEGEGGYFRRNHLVPVPKASSWEELNDFLLEASRKDEQGARIWMASEATDMRCGFDRLAERVRAVIGQNPQSGHLFVFRSGRGDRLKILVWDLDGFVLWYKRLEVGVFKIPRV
jgi:transposase